MARTNLIPKDITVYILLNTKSASLQILRSFKNETIEKEVEDLKDTSETSLQWE
jgi:hypothetical protein